jgi:acetylornithine/N-succinyldiaminopimelate aminotransferase
MLAEIAMKGALLHELGNALMQRKPDRVKAIRGKGLLFGIEVDTGAAEVVARCRQNGLLVNLAGEKTVRFAPAYISTREQLAEGLAIFERSL